MEQVNPQQQTNPQQKILRDKAKIAIDLKKHKDELAAQRIKIEDEEKFYNNELKKLSIELVEILENMELDKFSCNGYNFKPSTYYSGKIIDIQIVKKYLADNNMEDLLTINSQKMKSLLKELVKNGQPMPPAEAISVSSYTEIKITKGG